MPRVITDRCRAFLHHWESLRGGEVIPSLKDLLAHPHPDFQPYLMITDFVSKTEMPIRLFGTALVELTRADQTKRDFVQVFSTPGMSERHAEVAQIIVSRPCGTSNIKAASTAQGKEVELDMITLPVTPYPDSPPCLVSFVRCMSELEKDDFVYQVGRYIEATWVDIGAGVPDLTVSTNDNDTEEIDLQSQRDLFKTFQDHWFFLKGDRDVTRLSDFLNRPIPILQPNVTILDVDVDKNGDQDAQDCITMRLVGTALNESYGKDVTGSNLLELMQPTVAEPFAHLLSTMVKQPCGCDMSTTITSMNGRVRELRHLGFPLQIKDGEPQSSVWFNKEVEPTMAGKRGPGVTDLRHDGWIDVGFGVPQS